MLDPDSSQSRSTTLTQSRSFVIVRFGLNGLMRNGDRSGEIPEFIIGFGFEPVSRKALLGFVNDTDSCLENFV
jgi:hypothetical protein